MVRTVLFSWGYLLLVRQFSSVAQLCPTLCDPMDCSTSGFPAHHQLLELTQTHVHRVDDGIHPTISSSVAPFSSCLQSSPAPGSFPVSQLSASGGQRIGVSASASVLLMNIQDWFPFPLKLTGLILQTKELSRVFSNTTVQMHQMIKCVSLFTTILCIAYYAVGLWNVFS